MEIIRFHQPAAAQGGLLDRRLSFLTPTAPKRVEKHSGNLPQDDRMLLELMRIVDANPQRDSSERLLYLVASGISVRLLTAGCMPPRSHKDIDLAVIDPENQIFYQQTGADVATPAKFWGGMVLTADFLARTAYKVELIDSKIIVEVVHPAITLIQKLASSQRPQDLSDARALVARFKNELKSGEWTEIIKEAFTALPPGFIAETKRMLGRHMPQTRP